MLSSLATYLFGSGEAPQNATVEQLLETELTQDGNEWILIDAEKSAQPRSRSSVSSLDDMSCGSDSDAGGVTEEMPSDEEAPSGSSSPVQPNVHERERAMVQNAVPKPKRGVNAQKLAKPVNRSSTKKMQPQELPVVEVSSPSLPGPRSYAEIAAIARQEEAEVPKAKVTPAPVKIPMIVAKPVTGPSGFTKKKSNKRNANGAMEGSWFVTPPPCFQNPNTFMMESSPLEDILIEHPSISVFSPRPAPLRVEINDSPMTASATSSGSTTRSPTPPPITPSSPTITAVMPVPLMPAQATETLPIAGKAARTECKTQRLPQLQREPLSEVTTTSSGNVVVRLVLARSERKSRKQNRKEAKENEKRAAEQLRKSQQAVSTQDASVNAALLAEIRARAFEPIRQERVKQLRSRKLNLSQAYLGRLSAISKVEARGRRAKMFTMNGGHSVNRKVNRC